MRPFMKALLPVIILGSVLAVLVFTARCSQKAMHRYENAATDSVDNPNSAPSALAEQERMHQRFPQSLLHTSGIRFQILEPGTGPKPIPGNRVKVHYTGRLLDGTVFDPRCEVLDRHRSKRRPCQQRPVVRR